MDSFWDSRFAESEFAYGTEPNVFFKDQIGNLTPGRLLLPGEGQGRNAVYAAAIGWDVTAFDSSEVGRTRALELARKNETDIQYILSDYESFEGKAEDYDCIALIFAHQMAELRRHFHQRTVTWLRPGGTLIVEGFSKDQLGRMSGGPQNLDMLFSEEEMRSDFAGLSSLRIWKEEIFLDEGKYHKGAASVIRILGVK